MVFSLLGGSAFAAAKVSPLVELTFTKNTKIYGVTALDSLGKKTGTLEELAKSAIKENTTSYVAFPANFFHAYDDVKDVVGGIYSQGKIIYDNWMDWGCGFDKDNRFYLFSLISTISNEKNGKIVIKNSTGGDVEIVTAFNCYPWLIKDGEKAEIKAFPGATEDYLNSKVQRAFMGQKSDGTFVYGMLSNATMRGLQDACVELGLVNAVNTDGGASAGVYQNGKYLAKPGRELASVVYIAEEKKDEPSDWAKPEVTAAINAGLVPANLQKNYTQDVARGSVAQMIVNLIEKSCGQPIDNVITQKGAVVNKDAFNDTADKAVLAANALGIINGVGDKKFDPNGTFTRAQIAAIINRVAHLMDIETTGYTHGFTDVGGLWVDSELGWPVYAKIVAGVGENKFNPDGHLTTEQAIAITYRAMNAFIK